jgi:hypothetical protein
LSAATNEGAAGSDGDIPSGIGGARGGTSAGGWLDGSKAPSICTSVASAGSDSLLWRWVAYEGSGSCGSVGGASKLGSGASDRGGGGAEGRGGGWGGGGKLGGGGRDGGGGGMFGRAGRCASLIDARVIALRRL